MMGVEQVVELHRLFGTPDYSARVSTRDTAAYEVFLTDRVLTIPGISRVSSRFAMKTLKSLRPTRNAVNDPLFSEKVSCVNNGRVGTSISSAGSSQTGRLRSARGPRRRAASR